MDMANSSPSFNGYSPQHLFRFASSRFYVAAARTVLHDRNPFNTVESVSTRAARRRHPGTASTGSCCFVSGSLAVSRGLDKVPRRWILHGRASVSSGKPIYARAPDRPAVRPAPERRIKAGAIAEFVEKFIAFDFFQRPAPAPHTARRHPRPPPSLPEAGPGHPHARILPQEVGNIWDPKGPTTRYGCKQEFNNPNCLLVGKMAVHVQHASRWPR